MDACLLDVLHDRADHHALAVADGVDVDLYRRLEEIVEEEEFASAEEAPPLPERRPEIRTPRWQPPAVRRPDEKTARLASAFAAVEEKPAAARRGTKLQDLLSNRDSQRQAVILAEILGTPRGLVSAGGHW